MFGNRNSWPLIITHDYVFGSKLNLLAYVGIIKGLVTFSFYS